MDSKNLKRANEIVEELKELNYFLATIDPDKNFKTGGGSWVIDSVLHKITTIKYALFASRYFAMGRHESEIKIPNTVIPQLYELCQKHKTALENELKSL